MKEDFEKDVLKEFRKLLFPIIVSGKITGYNVYHNRKKSEYPFQVNYLHSDLGLLANGKQHPHREELLDKLKDISSICITEKITDSIIDRIATYKIGDWKENPQGLIFYTDEGRIIDGQELDEYGGIIIAEGKQYDLSLDIEDKQTVWKVLEVLNKYTYRCKVDDSGQVTNELNPNRIFGAWDIPLITITSNSRLHIKGFISIPEIVIRLEEYVGCTLTRRKNVKRYLEKIKQKVIETKRLVNKPFVVSYLEI